MKNSILPNKVKEGQLFQVKRNDLGPLLLDQMGLSPNQLSPLKEVLSSYSAGSGLLGSEGEKLLENELFRKLAPTLAAPDLLIKNRLGGSITPFEEMRACAGKSLGEAIVLVTIGDDSSYVLRLFDNHREYAQWWAESFAGKNDQVVANYIPPKVSLDAFLFLLHAVDWFRREAYQNALNYAAGEEIYVNPEQFSQGLSTSVSSKDLRWLVPSLIMVVPNIERYNFTIIPEDINLLNSMQFFNMEKKPGSGEDAFTFGEAGQVMGIEFMRTWLLSAGFELSSLAQGSIDFVDHFFIAPTGLANHFVSFEMTDNNRCLVNHQAFTLQYLTHKLETVFGQAMAEHAGKEDRAGADPVPPPIEKLPAAAGQAGPAPAGPWYMSREGSQYGPYTYEKLVEFARQGFVQPGDQVWNESLKGWARADSVKGLF